MALTITENREFIQTLFDFSSGLNTRDTDSKIRETELSDIRNFKYEKKGALSIRAGFKKINLTTIGSDPVMSMGGYYKSGVDEVIITTASTAIYKYVSSTQAYSSIKTGLTGDGLKFGMHQFMNHYFMGNGTDAIQVYNGTTVWDAGYTIPTTNLTATQGDAGVLENKTYKYKVAYYYADGESNSCSADSECTPAADKRIELTNIPTGNSRVTQRKLYRTIGGGTTYKLLTTLSDNEDTDYSDNIPDSGLGADMDIDNYAPADCIYSINHKARNWFAGDSSNPSRVWYTKALHPESVPSTYYWDVGLDDGDEITGLAVNLGALIIFKKYSTWVITGDLPTGSSADMILEKVNPTIGCVSYWTQAHAGNDLLFLTPNLGVHRLHRIILASTETMDAEALTEKIEPTIDGLNKSYLTEAHGKSYNHKYYLFVPNSTNTTPDICLVLDLRDMNPNDEETIAWTIYDNMNFTSSCWFLDSTGEHLYGGSSSEGFTYELESNTNDDGVKIEAYAESKYLEFGSFIHEKLPRIFGVHGRASEDYSFTTRVFTLYRGREYQDTFTFTGGGVAADSDVLWDENLFDQLLFDVDGGFTSVELDILKTAYLTKPAHKIKFKINSVSANQSFQFNGWEVRGFMLDSLPMA